MNGKKKIKKEIEETINKIEKCKKMNKIEYFFIKKVIQEMNDKKMASI